MKKRILSILLVAVMLISAMPVFAVATSADEATVTDWSTSPIVIKTVQDFLNFRTEIRNGSTFIGQTVELGADIDLSGVKESLGKNNKMNGIDSSKYFAGTFDGKYHTISNMDVYGYGYQSAMFGSLPIDLTTTAVIKNLAIVNATAKSDSQRMSIFYAAAYSSVSFENVYVNATVSASGNFSGGYVGHLGGNGVSFSCTNCVFDGSVTNSGGTGAIFGQVIDGTPDTYDNVESVTFTNCLNASTNQMLGANNNPNSVEITYNNCIENYDASVEDVPTGFTAVEGSYPVPNTLLPFFVNKVDATNNSTFFKGIQYNEAIEAIRFVGLIELGEGTVDDFASVGFEVYAYGPTGVMQQIDLEVTKAYTSITEEDVNKTAEQLGGDLIYVANLGGAKLGMGVATFVVKTYTVDANNVKTYTDMNVVTFGTVA